LVSLVKDDNNFICQDVCFTATSPKIPSGSATGLQIKYFLHCSGADEACLSSSSVVSTTGLYSPFDACPNTNMFQHLFGIEFAYENHNHVWGILPFKFAQCFGFIDNLTRHFSHSKNKSAWTALFQAILLVGSLGRFMPTCVSY
jgi:hypothetical protein